MTPLRRLGLAAAPLLIGAPAQAGELKVVIDDIASSSGTVVVGLYDRASTYESAIREPSSGSVNGRRRLVGVALKAAAGTQSVVFTDLKPGTYAVIVFHDENDNGKLDKNFLGIPTEAYGFSNAAAGSWRAPDFNDAAIVVGRENRLIRISLIQPSRPSGGP